MWRKILLDNTGTESGSLLKASASERDCGRELVVQQSPVGKRCAGPCCGEPWEGAGRESAVFSSSAKADFVKTVHKRNPGDCPEPDLQNSVMSSRAVTVEDGDGVLTRS